MILVTGATGLVGAHLLHRLVLKGEKIRAVYRTEKRRSQVEKIFSYYSENSKELIEKIEWLPCDITDVPKLSKAFKNITKVYHCAAFISFDPSKLSQLTKTNIEGTANIVNLAIANKVAKICYVSSIATLGLPKKDEEIDENTEWNPTSANVYSLTKYDAELEVWRGTQEGVPAVIVNPGVILGPGTWKRGSGSFFSRYSRKQNYALPGSTGYIGVDDVVAVMTFLMDAEIENERFVLVAENLPFKTVQTQILKAFGLPAPKYMIKPWQLQVFWRLDWLRHKITGSRRVLSKNLANTIPTHSTYSGEKLKQFYPEKLEPIQEVIKKCCAIYVQEH
ncbi:NAD-dependent epimerase [Croceivirga lutea]|uniref:NAD-dependent epimerase/dehydratase family protein n=1 Tax=Croceivirga lutea TaxID=1775167 RepID=UPI00163B206F|nr:NAD-dependent epimerase/dehydratase family protein [Croceivirga lutea]GGG36618.1 NAD-dependent epimerase [Croceivirga lutea]